MALGEDLIKKLKKKFEPRSTVDFKYRSYDVSVQTDDDGNAIRMFIGKFKDDGLIKGERYARVIVRDREGNVIKDHWDRKGIAS